MEFLKESNAIEGVYDEQSLKNAIWAFNFLMARDTIDPYLVLQVHEILMKDVGAWSEPKLLPKYRGVIRDCDVYIGGHKGMHPDVIKKELELWCDKMNYKSILSKNAIEYVISKDLHIEYEKIHPFVDGNGRTGRMFMNWYRIKNGIPILIIHEGEEQMEYYQWFKVDSKW